jgi:WD40 repeat protein
MHLPVPDGDVPPSLRRINWIPQRGSFEDDFEGSLRVLIDAVRTDLEALRAHTRWEQRASTWDERGRDPSLLARGTDMGEAEDWLAAQTGREPAPTTLQVEYVNASRRASSRRQRIVLGVSLAALAVAVVLGILALVQRNEARDQRDLARSNELASAALASIEIDPERSLILASEGAELRATPQTEQALARALTASRVRLTARPQIGTLSAAELSDDGRWLVIGGARGTEVYDARSGELVRSLDTGAVADLDVDPNDRQVATAGADGEVRSFVLTDGRPNGSIRVGAAPTTLTTSDDGAQLAVGNDRGQIRVLDYRSGRVEGFTAHRGAVRDLEFGSGSVLVSSGEDGAARLWDAQSGDLLGNIDAAGAAGVDADVSADGKTIAAVGADGIASVWDTATQKRVGAPLNDVIREGRAISVSFDDSGDRLLLGRDDGSSQMIRVASRALVGVYPGHTGLVQGEFGARDERLVTIGEDAVARIWDITPFERFWTESDDAVISDVEFAADAPIAAAGLSDGTVAIRDFDTGRRIAHFQAAKQPVQGLELNADGTALTVGSAGGLTAWDLEPATPAETMSVPGRYLSAGFSPEGDEVLATTVEEELVLISSDGDEVFRTRVAPSYLVPSFSTDGSRILAGGKGVTILDADSGDEIGSIEPSELVLSAAFDPAGERIATAGAGGSIEIWDADSGERVARLDNSSRVLNVAYTPDGERLVTYSQQGIKLWDSSSGLVLNTQPLTANQVELAPDGRRLAVVGPDSGILERWECELCVSDFAELAELAEQRTTRPPTEDEIETYGLE